MEIVIAISPSSRPGPEPQGSWRPNPTRTGSEMEAGIGSGVSFRPTSGRMMKKKAK
jgi:hypothetical protein